MEIALKLNVAANASGTMIEWEKQYVANLPDDKIFIETGSPLMILNRETGNWLFMGFVSHTRKINSSSSSSSMSIIVFTRIEFYFRWLFDHHKRWIA